MRKLIYAINMTLDGCVDHTKGGPNPEIYEYYGNLLREADTLLYGRKTYQLMVPYWPDIANANRSCKRRRRNTSIETGTGQKYINWWCGSFLPTFAVWPD
jgi:dihydrofolate reductase